MADIIDLAVKIKRITEQIDGGFSKYAAEFDRISEIPDLEEQGYQSAPILAQIACCDSETLLKSIFATAPSVRSRDNVMRDIGVVRWCLDQRKGRGQLDA